MSSDVHSGHRRRMKERFLAGGLEGFSDHEVLELILFYAIPRRDVNELSHRLIESFGSYKAVFEAELEDLLAVEGIGENAAVLIRLIAQAFRRYALYDEEVFVYDELEKVGNYAVRLYVGVSVEKLYAMLFDNKMKLLDIVMLSEGSVNSVGISYRTICERAFKKHASSVILIHNHPNGTPYPSAEDLRVSSILRDCLKTFEITLIEHIIVSGRYYRPMFEKSDAVEAKLAASINFDYGSCDNDEGIRTGDPDEAVEKNLIDNDTPLLL